MALPVWATTLREKYRSGQASLFVLHNNVHDLIHHGDEWLTLRQFIAGGLVNPPDAKKTKKIIFYDLSQGIGFSNKQEEIQFVKRCGVPDVETINRMSPDSVLRILEEFMKLPGEDTCLVLDYAETLAPAGDTGSMADQDRRNIVTLNRWATSPVMIRSDDLVILITESLTSLNRSLLGTPLLAEIEIDRPDAATRGLFIEHCIKEYAVKPDGDMQSLTENTSGLQLNHILNLFLEARLSGGGLDKSKMLSRKKELIRKECFGLLEFEEPEHGLEAVAGSHELVGELKRLSTTIASGRNDLVPMGLLFCGPNGIGKTFIAMAFAKECGLNTVTLKNFRDKWVGSTEANFEKIRNVLRSLGPVLVIIDEADAAIGGRGGDESGVDSRVFASLTAFMGDKRMRGKILWTLITVRPDLLQPDQKRPGRCDRHYGIFDPDNDEELTDFVRYILRKGGAEFSDEELKPLLPRLKGMSGADFDELLVQSRTRAFRESRNLITVADLEDALSDYIPASNTRVRELQNLLAAYECTSRKLLPGRYKDLDKTELEARIDMLKAELGMR